VTGPRRLARLDRTGLLSVLLFCNTFGVGAFGPLLPEIGRTQSLPDWQLGFVASAFGFARMAAAMPVGMLVVRRLAAALMAAPLILVLGLLLLVSAGSLPVLLVGRFLLGISHTLTMVGGLTAVLLEGGGTSVSTRLNLFEFAGMLGILGGQHRPGAGGVASAVSGRRGPAASPRWRSTSTGATWSKVKPWLLT